MKGLFMPEIKIQSSESVAVGWASCRSIVARRDFNTSLGILSLFLSLQIIRGRANWRYKSQSDLHSSLKGTTASL